MYREVCKVLSQEKVAPGHFVLTLEGAGISKSAKPGQFVQILCADSMDPLLPRPFSFLTATSKNFSILYHVVGKGTQILSTLKKGDVLPVLGPCGNGFNEGGRSKVEGRRKKEVFLLVGGGVGIPPLYHFSQELLKNKISKKNIHVFLGARDKSLLLCEKEFKKLGIVLHLATDNGSKGHKGFITQMLEGFLSSSLFSLTSSLLFTCGPTPMMKAVSAMAVKFKVPCEVSVEVPMACGFGACLGCAVKVSERTTCGTGETPSRPRELILRSGDLAATKDRSFKYAIACCEGPVFDGAKILWE